MVNRNACGRHVRRYIDKWAFLLVLGFLGCSLSVSAQTTQRDDLLGLNQAKMLSSHALDLRTLNSARYVFPWLTLGDRQRFSLSSGYDWIDPVPVDFLPAASVEVPARGRTAGAAELDSDYKAVEVKPKLVNYVHGEVGALYGTSAGSKFGREVESGYILGEIGNDKYQINVGAFYEHSSAHFPRH